MYIFVITIEEEQIYASMWEEDRSAKCRREETEAALQIERNREMLKVLTLQTTALEKQRQEMRELKEKEAQLLVQCVYKQWYMCILSITHAEG